MNISMYTICIFMLREQIKQCNNRKNFMKISGYIGKDHVQAFGDGSLELWVLCIFIFNFTTAI